MIASSGAILHAGRRVWNLSALEESRLGLLACLGQEEEQEEVPSERFLFRSCLWEPTIGAELSAVINHRLQCASHPA